MILSLQEKRALYRSMVLYSNPLKGKVLISCFPKQVWISLLDKGLLERFDKDKITISDKGVDYLLDKYPAKVDEIHRIVSRGRYEVPKRVDLSKLF